MQNAYLEKDKINPLSLANIREFTQRLWKDFLDEKSFAIDATCGNGFDTLFLAQILGEKGRVDSYDIQKVAIEKTKMLLSEKNLLHKVHLIEKCHSAFLRPADLVVYNLGYLPGSNQVVTTTASLLLQSLEHALSFAKAVSITCYPGHAEGKKEKEAVEKQLQLLPPKLWNISFHSWINRKNAPCLFWLTKQSR